MVAVESIERNKERTDLGEREINETWNTTFTAQLAGHRAEVEE